MIAAACDTAEKVIADARKQYGLGSRQGPSLGPTLDKAQAAKIQEQENILRAAVNFGEGSLRFILITFYFTNIHDTSSHELCLHLTKK